MTKMKIILLAATFALAVTGIARADCESDLIQLEQAFKTPNLTPDQTAALEEAKVKAVAALKGDDDKACNTAVSAGITKAGLTMK
ncbi:MAG: hypothetical protein KGQ46_14340 [Hyphomicrobiales bacterium]|nr:hypothetical protein [Hyphomicrobiales bacterium]MDE2115018.1 hypothetical protein [Hyphomicrobiales bacterium]